MSSSSLSSSCCASGYSQALRPVGVVDLPRSCEGHVAAARLQRVLAGSDGGALSVRLDAAGRRLARWLRGQHENGTRLTKLVAWHGGPRCGGMRAAREL